MNEQKKKMELLGSAPISKALLAMGVPTMIGMLVNALYNLADTYFVGGIRYRSNGSSHRSLPPGAGYRRIRTIIWERRCGLSFQAPWTRRSRDCGQSSQHCHLLQYCRWSHRHSRFHYLFKSHPEGDRCHKQRHALCHRLYAHLYHFFLFFNVFNVTMNNIVSSEGSAKTAMCALMTGAILNVLLDPLFIYVLDFGVAGAAIATAISQIVSTIIYIIYILRKKSIFSFHIKECCFSKRNHV